MIQTLVKKLSDPAAPPIGKTLGSLALNISNQIFLLLITMLLTRLMVPSEYGLYAIIISFMMICAIPFSAGLPVFMIRHLSTANAKKNYSLFRGLTNLSVTWILTGAIIIAAIGYFSLPIFIPQNFHTYRAGLPLIILPPLLLWCGTILRAQKKVLLGRFPEFFIQPLFFSTALLFLFLFHQTSPITSAQAIIIHTASYGIALCIAFVIMWCLYPSEAKKSPAAYKTKSWIKSALPLLCAVGLVVINSNIDIIMVGALADQEQAGQYRVASRLAGFVLFFLFAANNAMGPIITAHHAKGEQQQAQQKITSMARLIFTFSVPIIIIFLMFPQDILTLLFGNLFAAGGTALMILTIANGFSMSMGQAGNIMSLTGKEKYSAYAATLAIAINILLNIFLIPRYGMNGAAIGTGTSIIFWNGLLAYWTAKKAGYHTTIFGKLFKP